jgi:hypothetical protein
MADWVRGINRLRSLLGSIFPALEAAFDYSTRTPLILVAGLCTPAEIRAAGTEGVTDLLVAHRAWAPGIAKTAATAVALADDQHVALPGETGTAALVKRVAVKLLELDREIKDLDKTIAERFRDHPYARIIESLPGFGPNLGAEFLVVTRGDLASFVTAGRSASYAGLVPVPQDSGRVSGNLRRPKRFNRRLRRVFYLAALSSLRTNGPSRQFYDRKRGERFVQARRCSPWRGASSTCCGPCYATAVNSPLPPLRLPPLPNGILDVSRARLTSPPLDLPSDWLLCCADGWNPPRNHLIIFRPGLTPGERAEPDRPTTSAGCVVPGRHWRPSSATSPRSIRSARSALR